MTETDSKEHEAPKEPVPQESVQPETSASADVEVEVNHPQPNPGGVPDGTAPVTPPPLEQTQTETAAEAGSEAGSETAAEAGSETATGTVPESATVPGTPPPLKTDTETEAETEAEAEGKKKRRRRRKKKAPVEDAASSAKTPFLRLFSGGRKHAFSVGEVIAGRVERVQDGTVVVDLFGKALAVADVDEPRDIEMPPVPEPKVFLEADAVVVAETETVAETVAETEPVTETPLEAEASVSSVGGGVTPEVASGTPPGQGRETVDDDAITEPGTVEAPEVFPEADPGAITASGEQPAAPAPQQEDLSDADLTVFDPLPTLEPPEVGGIFRGRVAAVAESGHIAIVNRLIDRTVAKKALRAARADRRRVQGIVFGYNRGGFDVLVAGVRAFCPASVMSLERIADPNELIGKKLEFSLPENKGKGKSIIVSRRNILEKEARKRARDRMGELKVGDKMPGKVIEVRDYGVLVDIGGGLDGLVHLSELSWKRGARPEDVAKPGDEVEVEVVKLQPATRKDRYGRVSLSLRACAGDPWDEAKDILKPGNAVKGKVVRTTDFGAFIELTDGIEGLLHISELGGRNVTHANQVLNEGQEIDVVVERLDKGQRRISLSKLSEADKKALEAGEFDPTKAPKSLKAGSHVTVLVKRVEHQGAQVQVEGVIGKRGRGFIPNRELEEPSGSQRKCSQGDHIEVKILGTDRDGSLRCSVKARLLDEERQAVRDYRKEASKQGLGTFGDLLKAKLGDVTKDS